MPSPSRAVPRREPESLQRLRDLASRGNVVPLYREVPADLLTPVGAFLRAAGPGDSFLLESVEGGEAMARYSFLGTRPLRRLRARGERLEEAEADGAFRNETGTGLDRVRDWLRPLNPVLLEDMPRFTGGVVGYLSYDAVRWMERISETVLDDLRLPDMEMAFYDTVLAFDHLRHRILVITNVFTEGGDLEAKHRRAVQRLDAMEEALRRGLADPAPNPAHEEETWTPQGDRESFTRKVRRAQEYIRAGDIFQAVLSQRFQRPFQGDPFNAYRALRRVNPSPYMFHLKLDDVTLCGASPEMLVRVENGEVQTRPIAGTRRRGKDRAEDQALEAELKADPKEVAEHVMLVDLGRNDLGRVCRPGSVRLEQFQEVERYSHVMHLCSSVHGALADGVDALDALAACFPAGTVSGAPKVRAMEIIDELEDLRRGPYAGTVAYLDFSGNLDACITIRTLVITGGMVYAQAGAGVVADSRPEREHTETVEKASVLLEAARLAEEMGS
jgi:anthranilate synthase component 1